eukprot:1722597-Rhodomonas_salina.5
MHSLVLQTARSCCALCAHAALGGLNHHTRDWPGLFPYSPPVCGPCAAHPHVVHTDQILIGN